jgi:hypothetical protein
MNLDFTRNKYRQLLVSLQSAGFSFIAYSDYCQGVRPERFVILRHDVDLLPYHSLATAKIEHELGIRAVYYFRAVPESWDETVIKEIAGMGHEVGYHYESLTTCNGNLDAAYEDFKKHLSELRSLTAVETICMHGSPRSPFDSKDIWKKYNYKSLGIIGEPYLDTDFSQMLYLTDTGRCWDGYKVSVRDKIPTYQDGWTEKGWVYHKTDDIILAIQKDSLPSKLMITTHPQRWNENLSSWLSEYIMQNIKNIVKKILIKRNRQ